MPESWKCMGEKSSAVLDDLCTFFVSHFELQILFQTLHTCRVSEMCYKHQLIVSSSAVSVGTIKERESDNEKQSACVFSGWIVNVMTVAVSGPSGEQTECMCL